MNNYKINIVHLYPELLNLYGDKGNIECLKRRLIWRGIDADVRIYNSDDERIDFKNTDIIFLGGGSDREQEIVLEKLITMREELTKFVEEGGTFIALCGGFEMICRQIIKDNTTESGLGLVDAVCSIKQNQERLIGNVVLSSKELKNKIVGFENHAGRIDIKNGSYLGEVEVGYGNNEETKYEGIIYKNLIASYLHGPLFPKNPELCDMILLNTLKHKYSDFKELESLDDSLEIKANEYMLKRLCK